MKKKENIFTAGEKIASKLEIPKDVILDLSKVIIVGAHDVTIENYRGIIQYDSELIRLNTKTGMVKISGLSLEITEISDEDISITGLISSVEFVR